MKGNNHKILPTYSHIAEGHSENYILLDIPDILKGYEKHSPSWSAGRIEKNLGLLYGTEFSKHIDKILRFYLIVISDSFSLLETGFIFPFLTFADFKDGKHTIFSDLFYMKIFDLTVLQLKERPTWLFCDSDGLIPRGMGLRKKAYGIWDIFFGFFGILWDFCIVLDFWDFWDFWDFRILWDFLCQCRVFYVYECVCECVSVAVGEYVRCERLFVWRQIIYIDTKLMPVWSIPPVCIPRFSTGRQHLDQLFSLFDTFVLFLGVILNHGRVKGLDCIIYDFVSLKPYEPAWLPK